MKTQNLFLTTLALAISLLGIGCSPTSSPSSSSSVTASSTLQLTSSAYNIAYGGTATITASGGASPYTFSVVGSVGTIAPVTANTATYTAPTSGNTYVQINVLDATSATATLYLTLGSGGTGGTSTVLNVSPLNSYVAPGGTLAFTVSGGTAPYYYVATAGSFSTTGLYTAPSTIQTVTATIYDSAGNSTQTSIYVGTTGSSGTYPGNCSGNFNLQIGTVQATLTLVEDTSGNIAGSISFTGYNVTDAVSGTCTGTTISFIRMPSGQQWVGNLIVNSNNTSQTFMTGTVQTSAGTQSWYGSN